MTKNALLCAIILLLGVMIGGCATVSLENRTASTTAVATQPSLLGNWTGTSSGYVEGAGYTTFSDTVMTLRITEQQGRVFSGEIALANQSGIWKRVPCAGVIGRDGTTLSMVQQGGGSSSGSLVAPNEIEFIYTDKTGSVYIAIDSLKKV